MEYYNQLVIKYCVLGNYDSGIFNSVKSDWFCLTPKSFYVYKLCLQAIDAGTTLDDATLLAAYHSHGQIIYNSAKTRYGSNTFIDTKGTLDEIDRELNDIIRNTIQAKIEIDYEKRVMLLRNSIATLYDEHKFIESLHKAKNLVQTGNSIDTAMLEIHQPEQIGNYPADFNEQAQRLLKSAYTKPLNTGMDGIVFERGNIVVVEGDTGAMKTRWTLWLCLQALENNPDETCVFFEKEMGFRDTMHMIFSYCLEISVQEIRRIPEPILVQYMSELPPEKHAILNRIKVFGGEDFESVEDIHYHVNRIKPTFFVIDYLTMLTKGTDENGFNLNVMSTIDKIKDIVHRTDTVALVICQLRKGTVELRTNKIPTMDDIEWSARIKQLAAYVFAVFYPHYYDFEVNPHYFFVPVLKNRFAERQWKVFSALPEKMRFYIPDDVNLSAMREWLDSYRKRKK